MKNILSNIIYILITIIALAILCFAGIFIAKKIEEYSFLNEAKTIFASVKTESEKNDKTYYDNEGNWLKTYNGVYNYVVKLDEEKNIIYYMIFNEKYSIEKYTGNPINTDVIANSDIKQIENIEVIKEKQNKIVTGLKENVDIANLLEEKRNDVTITPEKTIVPDEKNDVTVTPEKTIIPEEKDTEEQDSEKLTYVIGDTVYYYQGKSKNADVVGETVDGKYVITISMGEQPTGGYSIDVMQVKIKENDAIIMVRTKSPASGSNVTQAITHPAISITFNKKPNSYRVINEDGTNYIKK